MGEENNNENNEINTTALHNLMFFIIILLLLAILYFAYKANYNTTHSQNIGSLQHYDSIYSNRETHYSMNQNGDITGYHTPDGLYYTFEEPIPANIFFND